MSAAVRGRRRGTRSRARPAEANRRPARPPGPPPTIELDIDSIAAGGDGVGRDADGRVVFVPVTTPGDRVRAEITVSKRRWARGRMREHVVEAPERRIAPCPVYGLCGGCRLQHLPEDRQAAAKRDIVAAALARIGGLEVEVPEMVRTGEPFGYRNRVTLTLRREGGHDRAGFRALYTPAEVVDCPNCLLAEAPVRVAWDALVPWDALPAGRELRVTIRASAAGRIALLVEGGTAPGDPAAVAARLPALESYWWAGEDGARRLLAGDERFVDEWQGIRFELEPTVFLQVNRAASVAMDAWLDGRAEPLPGLRVADLYAGVGARAIRWARAGAVVATCEIDPAACEASRAAARRAEVDLRVHEGRVEEHPELLNAELVVVNPPRAGLAPVVRDALAAGPAAAVAYVSCDPATLARDLEQMGGAYRLTEVQPFDAFPQTAHIETIAWLERREGDGSPGRPAADPDPAADPAADTVS